MAHTISDACVSCGACADTCPVSAIAEGDNQYVVDADACIDCGLCEEKCPQKLDVRKLLRKTENVLRSL